MEGERVLIMFSLTATNLVLQSELFSAKRKGASGAHYTDALWALRYRVASGKNLPHHASCSGHDVYSSADTVFEGHITKVRWMDLIGFIEMID
jgi:hypothetical protein